MWPAVMATPLEAKTGDTVTVTVEPLDAGGNLVEHAVLAGPIKLQDYPDRPWVNVDATGLSGKFIMPETGNVRVIWTVVHGPTPSILASVTVTRR